MDYCKAKLFNPLTPNVAIWVGLHPVPDRFKPSFEIFWHPGTLTLRGVRAGCQSARTSKITNECLTLSGTGRMLYSCTHTATAGVKGLKLEIRYFYYVVFIVSTPLAGSKKAIQPLKYLLW